MTTIAQVLQDDTLSPELLHAVASTIRRSLRVMSVPEPLSLSRWAEKHFYLSAESSYVEGRWHCWPPQRALMDVMGHDEIHHVTIRKSARVGYTKMMLAHTAYEAEHKRRNAVIYQPTDDDRDEFVTTELEPMLRDVACMRRVMPRFSRRSKDNTLRQKKFVTGLLHLRGGKAAKNYRRLTVDTVKYDEFDGFDRDIEKEGSPGKLGDKRTEGAVWPKSIAGTTPKLKGLSNVEDREAEADARIAWHVPCPHCDELHPITFGGTDKPAGLKCTDRDATTVAHVCPHCGGMMTQAQYLEVWEVGLWIDTIAGLWIDHLGNWRTPSRSTGAPATSRPTPPPSSSPRPRRRPPVDRLRPPGHLGRHLRRVLRRPGPGRARRQVPAQDLHQHHPRRDLGRSRRAHRRTRPPSPRRNLSPAHHPHRRPHRHRWHRPAGQPLGDRRLGLGRRHGILDHRPPGHRR